MQQPFYGEMPAALRNLFLQAPAEGCLLKSFYDDLPDIRCLFLIDNKQTPGDSCQAHFAGGITFLQQEIARAFPMHRFTSIHPENDLNDICGKKISKQN